MFQTIADICTLNYSPEIHFKNKYIYTEKQKTINKLHWQKRAKMKSSERRSYAVSSGEDGVLSNTFQDTLSNIK